LANEQFQGIVQIIFNQQMPCGQQRGRGACKPDKLAVVLESFAHGLVLENRLCCFIDAPEAMACGHDGMDSTLDRLWYEKKCDGEGSPGSIVIPIRIFLGCLIGLQAMEASL
jgi:hypothetical protein